VITKDLIPVGHRRGTAYPQSKHVRRVFLAAKQQMVLYGRNPLHGSACFIRVCRDVGFALP